MQMQWRAISKKKCMESNQQEEMLDLVDTLDEMLSSDGVVLQVPVLCDFSSGPRLAGGCSSHAASKAWPLRAATLAGVRSAKFCASGSAPWASKTLQHSKDPAKTSETPA
jgi:hypothetical protein